MQAGGVEFDNAVRQWLIAQVAQARWADTQSKENDASIGTSTGAVVCNRKRYRIREKISIILFFGC